MEGNILAQLQKVDKCLKNLLMSFFKSYAHVLYHYWSGMGTCHIFFLFAIKCFCHSIWIQVQNYSYDKVLYLSHSKVELLYLFKRHMSDFFNEIFLKDFWAYSFLLEASLGVYCHFSLHFAFKWWCY